MAQPAPPKVKALDGTVQPLACNGAVPEQQSSITLPSRTKDGIVSLNGAGPPPGQTLTGKQEHCKLSVLQLETIKAALILTIGRFEARIAVAAGQI